MLTCPSTSVGTMERIRNGGVKSAPSAKLISSGPTSPDGAVSGNSTVLTTTPHYNDEPEAAGRQPLQPYWGRWVQQSQLNGIRVLHVYAAPKGSRVSRRAFGCRRHHLLGTLVGLPCIERPDIVFAPSSPLTIRPHA